MTVQTRSMTNNAQARSETNSSINKKSSKTIIKKEKTFRFVTNNTPKPQPTLITKEEFDKIKDGYIMGIYGGYVKLEYNDYEYLVVACIPDINSSVDDYISVCREDKDKIYAIAPNGYYWGLKKIYSAGYQYVLERFDK